MKNLHLIIDYNSVLKVSGDQSGDYTVSLAVVSVVSVGLIVQLWNATLV